MAPLIGRAVSLIALTGDEGLSAPAHGLDKARKTIITAGHQDSKIMKADQRKLEHHWATPEKTSEIPSNAPAALKNAYKLIRYSIN